MINTCFIYFIVVYFVSKLFLQQKTHKIKVDYMGQYKRAQTINPYLDSYEIV